MTRDLPDEILLIIFKDLSPSDLLNCQLVSRSWYSPAHIKLLKKITLTRPQAIEQFIASFDNDSNQTYIKAVEAIHFWRRRQGSCDLKGTVLEKETFEKLFYRFPNLKKVLFGFSSLITNFDEDLCHGIFLRCLNLDTFDVNIAEIGTEFCASLLKVQPLLTEMHLYTNNYIADVLDPIQFITLFPHLRGIYCDHESLLPFDSFLSILEKLPFVNNLHLTIGEDSDEDFGGHYLATRPYEVQELVKKRFSNITHLYIRTFDYIKNVLKFVSDYCSGLERFKMECDLLDWQPEVGLDVGLWNAFKLIPVVKKSYRSNFQYMPFATLSNSFPYLLQNMFDKIPPVYKLSNKRILCISVISSYLSKPYVDLAINYEQSPFTREIRINADERIDLDDFASQLFKSAAPMALVDVFVLNCKEICNMLVDTGKYLRLLGTMPSLKKVDLDIPETFLGSEDQDNLKYAGPVLSQVQEATFRATPDGALQSLLDSCCYTFPNLKRLNVFNFHGVWTAHIGEFFINLQNYSLEKLVFDTKPIVTKMNKFKFTYLVVKIEVRSRGSSCLYKVSRDHSSCNIIDLSDLEGFKCGRDYLRIRVDVDCLKQMELRVLGNANAQSCVILLEESE